MSRFKYGPASFGENHVYGAQRPGYHSTTPSFDAEVEEWVEYMRLQGIKRVCCLLEAQLSYYDSDLLGPYKRAFGEEALCWAPIEDFTFADEKLLTGTILPFLASSVSREEPVVVHCSGGIGRTGHVLAAWLVYGRGMTNNEAISAVIEKGRNPQEAETSNASGGIRLNKLLDACRAASSKNST